MAEKENIIVIANVSQSMFSVARYYGCARVQGEDYTYFAEHDILVRRDWEKVCRMLPYDDFIAAVKTGIKPKLPQKESKRTRKTKEKQSTPTLFD